MLVSILPALALQKCLIERGVSAEDISNGSIKGLFHSTFVYEKNEVIISEFRVTFDNNTFTKIRNPDTCVLKAKSDTQKELKKQTQHGELQNSKNYPMISIGEFFPIKNVSVSMSTGEKIQIDSANISFEPDVK